MRTPTGSAARGVSLFVVILMALPATAGRAQTVINVPPDVAPSTVPPDATLNVLDGGFVSGPLTMDVNSTLNLYENGSVYSDIDVYSGAEVNVLGGRVYHDIDAQANSIINVSDGLVEGEIELRENVQFSLSGGEIKDYIWVHEGAELEITGGVISSYLWGIRSRGGPYSMNMSGGSITGKVELGRASTFSMSAGELEELRGSAETIDISGGYIGDESEFGAEFLTIDGATLGNDVRLHGDIVDISDSSFGEGLWLVNGRFTSLRGGTIGDDFTATHDTHVVLNGTQVGNDFALEVGAGLTFSGGTIGDRFRADSGTSAEIVGYGFQLDGVPVAGVDSVGDVVALNLGQNSTLAGQLADGTPFVFSAVDGDQIADGALTLRRSAPAPAGPAVIDVPSDVVPLGIAHGQTINVRDGGNIPSHFNAGAGSIVNVLGGTIGDNLEAYGTELNVSGGIVGDFADVFEDTVANISGGEIGYGFAAHSGSTVNISGGTIQGTFDVYDGATVNVSGGTVGTDGYSRVHRVVAHAGSALSVTEDGVDASIGYVEVLDGAHADIGEGHVERVEFDFGGTLSLSGGTVGYIDDVVYRAELNVTGGSIARGPNVESGASLVITGGSVPKLISEPGARVEIRGFDFAIDGVPVDGLDIEGNSVGLNLSDDQFLSGVLSDGTPFIFAGEDIRTFDLSPDHRFSDGTLHLTRSADAPQGPASVDVTSPTSKMGARDGQVINVLPGGELRPGFTATSGAIVNVNGGQVGALLTLHDATLNVSAGDVAGSSYSNWNIAYNNSVINVDGGFAGSWGLFSGSRMDIDGGGAGTIDAVGGHLSVSGGGQVLRTNVRNGSVLDVSDATILYGFYAENSTVNLGDGTVAGSYQDSSTGEGAVVNIDGGVVGSYFEIGSDSTVNLFNGQIGSRSFMRSGAAMNVMGGYVGEYFGVDDGAVVNIYGGKVGRRFVATSGSEVNIFGYDFLLDGEPIDGLAANGDSLILHDRYALLTGRFADGSQFEFLLNERLMYDETRGDGFAADATLRLTVVPEPAAFTPLLIGILFVLRCRNRQTSYC